MSHATYCFLINGDPDDVDNIGPVAEYLQDRTDENNWYTPELIVHQDGRISGLAPAGDWRGRDGWYTEYEKIPVDKRFEEAMKFADSCVRYEIEGDIHYMTNDYKYHLPEKVTIEEITKIALSKITEHVAEKVDKPNLYAMENLLSKLRQLEYIDRDLGYLFTSDDENPYETIRAIDMREAEWNDGHTVYNNENLAVVLVDIHT